MPTRPARPVPRLTKTTQKQWYLRDVRPGPLASPTAEAPPLGPCTLRLFFPIAPVGHSLQNNNRLPRKVTHAKFARWRQGGKKEERKEDGRKEGGKMGI